MHYRLSNLDNGLRAITEHMPEVRSVAIGCWVDTGTRDELTMEAGCSHFLEHLLFKGTEELTARDISDAFDAVGGQSNAFTSKDYTCYWARLLDEDLPMGLHVLSEMLQRPAFRPAEIDAERQVVLEEINMHEDDPGDVAHEQFFQALWAGHPLERPVLGTRESIRGMGREDILGYWKRRYQPASLVVAVAGHLDHDQVVEQVKEHFGDWSGETNEHGYSEAVVEPRVKLISKETEQAHLVLGGEGLERADDRRFAFDVMNHVLGGGMSSRLFREIREERGLAYSVYSFRAPHAETGAYGVYVGTTPTQTATVLELVHQELDKMAREGLSPEELERAKSNQKGRLALTLEDPNSRMTRLGRTELAGMEHLEVDEVIRRVEDVTAADVVAVAEDLFEAPRVIGAVGPFAPADLEPFVR
jgi:predicted Zn-dependent peptidase